MSCSEDPFRNARETSGTLMTEFNGESIPFVLLLKDLRKTVKDWETFSSNHPFQVVPHTEGKVRTMRQIPIEMDPPEHTDFRAIVEPIFKRPLDPVYISNMEELIGSMVSSVLDAGEIDAVYDFSLPLQCRALTRLLNMPEQEAKVWEAWGLHALSEGTGLEEYTAKQFALAEREPGEDFFSFLNQVEFRGRKFLSQSNWFLPGWMLDCISSNLYFPETVFVNHLNPSSVYRFSETLPVLFVPYTIYTDTGSSVLVFYSLG
jgi:cytochrome P450